jgi:hypothetical protein
MLSINAELGLPSPLDESKRAELRRLLGLCFSLEEIKTLAFDIGIDFDELEGDSKTSKIRSLILSMERQHKLETLIAAAARERPDIVWHQDRSPAAICPYRGLSPFGEQDASLFFGRERFVEQLVAAVHRHELVAVIGSSGSGKSSLVFAGLLPQLHQQGEWIIIQARPGRQPFDELARALIPVFESQMSETDRLLAAHKLSEGLNQKDISLWDVLRQIAQKNGGRHRIVLLVDQFEELYANEIDEQTRQHFLDTLLTIVNNSRGLVASQIRIKIVLTLRADFMGRVLVNRPLADALQGRDLKLGPMTRQEMEAAIRFPAERSGLRFESGLVKRILDDLMPSGLNQMDTSNLPLLEFALEQLWTLRTPAGLLTHDAYEAIGEAGGAISRYADELYEGMASPTQIIMRRLLIQMVHPGGVEDTRRWVTRSEIGNADWSYIAQLAAERLVVTDQDVTGQDIAEVIHEALIQKWGRMQEWLKEDRPFRTWQDQMRVALSQWQKSGNDDDLLSGTPLSLSREWIQKRRENLTEKEVDFVQRSFAHDRERQTHNFYLFLFESSLGAAIGAGLAIAMFTLRVWEPDNDQFYKLPLPITVLASGLIGAFIGAVQGLGTSLGLAGSAILKKPSISSCILVTMVTSGVTGGIFFFILRSGGTFRPELSLTSIIALGFFVFALSSGGLATVILMIGKRYPLRTQIALAAISAAIGAFMGAWIACQLFGYVTKNSVLVIALGFAYLEGFLCGGMAWGLDFAGRQGNMPRAIDALRSASLKGEIND